MRSLNSICRAREEARYISRTWSNTPSAPDVPWEPVYKKPVESPDDIISVCVLNPKTLSGLGSAYIKRSDYEANKDKYKADIAQWEAQQKAKGQNK
jgi:hypothetical protein